jgi:hypothetical protein
MSLAMYAAPFNENSDMNDSDNLINKKRQNHNKTQKVYPKENFDANKVSAVLENIHNNSKEDDNDLQEGLADFNPPPKPQSAGVNKTNSTEQMMNMSNQQNSNNLMFRTLGRAPQPNYESEHTQIELNNYNNYGDNKSIEDYYKKMLPGYNPNRQPMNKPYYNMPQMSNESPSQDVLLQKLNYMISLLEDQKDEKTSNVTEEVVLYSFLGIFIIFIVDSFARAGKYVR